MAKGKKAAPEAGPLPSTPGEVVVNGKAFEPPALHAKPASNPLKRLWHRYITHKKTAIPLTVLGVAGLVLAVPFTRHAALGLFIQRDFSVMVRDAKTAKPVSEADVILADTTLRTDGTGKVVFRKAQLGRAPLTVKKKYYKDHATTATVDLSSSKNTREVKLEATGRQVPVTVTNKITGKGLKGVKITVLDTESETDEKGEATIVVPADKTSEKVTLKLEGYNEATTDLQVSEQLVDKNKLSLTPTGKIYFLSKLSGKVDVVSTNLDGSDRQTVVAGTGKEDEFATVLFASRDWKYLALLSTRDGKKAKLYLVETATNKLTVMDEGDASFFPIGWYNEFFLFRVERANKKPQDDKQAALKHFNAKTGQLKTLDETAGEGTHHYDYVRELYGDAYILDNLLVYTKRWESVFTYYYFPYNTNNRLQGKQAAVYAVRPDGSGKKVLKGLPLPLTNKYNYLFARLSKPNELYFRYSTQDNVAPESDTFFEYENGVIKNSSSATISDFHSKNYPTYLISPSGGSTFWHEARDGKSTLFLGNKDGEDERQIATLTELSAYGWYGEEYLLASKKGSELYIMSKDKDAVPFKIADFHRPNFNSSGYGYGYGGF